MARAEEEEEEEAEETSDVNLVSVMAGLVPAIHVFKHSKKDVDARVKPAHDV